MSLRSEGGPRESVGEDKRSAAARGVLESLTGFCPCTPLKSEIASGLWLQQESEQFDTEKNFLTMKTESVVVTKVGMKFSSPYYSLHDPGKVSCMLCASISTYVK